MVVANAENIIDISAYQIERSSLLDTAKALQEASRLKSKFLANMSHDIRTPLNVILGITQLMLEDQSQSYHKNCGSLLLTIVNDILDLAKIEAGNIQLHRCPFAFASLLNDIEAIMTIASLEKRLSLLFTVAL